MSHRRYLWGRGFTYFAQGEDGGPIKIGHTRRSPWGRVYDLQTGSPVRLVLIGVLVGTDYEREFHRAFADDRLHGEWFTPSDSLIETIRAMEDKQRDDPDAHPIRVARFNAVADYWATQIIAAQAALAEDESETELWRTWERAKEALTAAEVEHLPDSDNQTYVEAVSRLGRLIT